MLKKMILLIIDRGTPLRRSVYNRSSYPVKTLLRAVLEELFKPHRLCGSPKGFRSTRYLRCATKFPLAHNFEPSYTCRSLHKTLLVVKIIISAIFIVISGLLFYYSIFLGWASGAGIPEQVGYLKKYSNYALIASFISFWLAILIWPILSKLKNRRAKQVKE